MTFTQDKYYITSIPGAKHILQSHLQGSVAISAETSYSAPPKANDTLNFSKFTGHESSKGEWCLSTVM